MGLAENLKLATEVAMIVAQKVPRQSNAREAGRPILADGTVFSEIAHADLKEQRKGYKGKPLNALEWAENWKKAKNACYKSGMGNCGEMAGIACLELREKGAKVVELVEIRAGALKNPTIPHVIAVVGRARGARDKANPAFHIIGLPSHWGNDTVICDPWSRIAYPASQYDQFWSALKTAAGDSAKYLNCELKCRLTDD
jgi:hypothetical protein